jgi:predicted dehydrogenase
MSIQEAAAESSGSVMLGFNRRYAPATVAALAALKACHGPIHITYRVNAGRLAAEHWYSNMDESGGRILGEACHFFDFFCFLTQSTPRRVFATSLNPGNDGISASIQFVNGSTAQLLYTADGDSSYPKESWSVLAANVAVDCLDFRQLVLHQKRKRRVLRFGSKGHAEEMQQWLDFLLVNQPHPQSFDSLLQAMLLTFTVLDSVREQRAIFLSNEV